MRDPVQTAVLAGIASALAGAIAVAIGKWAAKRLYRLAKRTIKLVSEFREFLESRPRDGQELAKPAAPGQEPAAAATSGPEE
jgi:hypothetical protein